MTSSSLDGGRGSQRGEVASSGDRAPARGDCLLIATKWCATVVGIIQLLLAGLHCWILIDLHLFGTALTPFAIAFAATFVGLQFVILSLAWTLSSSRGVELWVLTAAYLLGLVILLAMFVAMEFDVELGTLIVQPGAKLPPNEIMGRGWPVGVAIMAFGLAQLLGILPLGLVVLSLWMRSRSPDAAK